MMTGSFRRCSRTLVPCRLTTRYALASKDVDNLLVLGCFSSTTSPSVTAEGVNRFFSSLYCFIFALFLRSRARALSSTSDFSDSPNSGNFGKLQSSRAEWPDSSEERCLVPSSNLPLYMSSADSFFHSPILKRSTMAFA